METNLVNDSRLQTVLRNFGSTHIADALLTGSSRGFLKTLGQSGSNEGECGGILDERCSGAMSQDEAWHAGNAVIAPWSFSGVESLPAHDRRPGLGKHFLD